MTNYAKGKEYEEFVTQVYKAIHTAEGRLGKAAPKVIEQNKNITSQSGTSAEIDIYWEYEFADIKQSVAIECKNYNENIDISQVRDFAHKIQGISGLKGLMITKEGFSDEAIKLANFHNIDLRTLRKPKGEDWEGRISGARFQMHILSPPEILRFTPIFNKDWIATNGYKSGEPVTNGHLMHDHIFLEDKADGFKEHLHALRQKNFFEDKGYGKHLWRREFKDGWMHIPDKSLKMDIVEIEYEHRLPVTSEFRIDFEEYVLAVMEFINTTQEKAMVLKDGQRRSL